MHNKKSTNIDTIKVSDISGVAQILDICNAKNMQYVVVSPGSRNAPLSISFARDNRFTTKVVVDERSAAYFALGIAQQTLQPVGLVCTSGTALLNYASAIAEAFYQRLPLVIIAADRPVEWIGQDDSQAINQQQVFANFVKQSYQLPNGGDNASWYINRVVNEALNLCVDGRMGPVHINVPFNEPLYGLKEHTTGNERIIDIFKPADILPQEQLQQLADEINSSKKVLIIAGLMHQKLAPDLADLAENKNVVVLTESVANMHNNKFLPCIDRVICSITEEEVADFQPDLLINFGGALISKMIKAFLRKNKAVKHWFIGKEQHHIDTFQQLTTHINIAPKQFFQQLSPLVKPVDSNYATVWQHRDKQIDSLHHNFVNACEWSDLKAFDIIWQQLPEKGNLQLANSSVVRYAQLFKTNKKLTCNANRGTSGIDGSSSTAVGASQVNANGTVLITGDISFFYDSNALWNRYLKDDFKIILVNNGGGGIFRFIAGASDADELEEYFEVKQDYRADKLAETYGLNYRFVDNATDLQQQITTFFQTKGAGILEIKTPRTVNNIVLKNYFKNIKENIK